MTSVQLPAGATQARSVAALEQVERYYLQHEAGAVESVFGVAGFSFAGSGENVAMAFVKLKDWSARGAGQGAAEVAARANRAFAGLRDARVFAMMPPAVQGLGNASGFDGTAGQRRPRPRQAGGRARRAAGRRGKEPALAGVRANGLDDTPQVQLSVDFAKAGALGVAVADVNDVLSTAWGGAYVNDFLHEGRVKKVYLQGEPSSRMQPADIAQWYVRNSSGGMVPFSAFATAAGPMGRPGWSATTACRRSRSSAAPRPVRQRRCHGGTGAPGQAAARRHRCRMDRPVLRGAAVRLAGAGPVRGIRAGGLPVPAALYESWSIPFSVMLVVPLGVLGALLAATLRGLSNDVYFRSACSPPSA